MRTTFHTTPSVTFCVLTLLVTLGVSGCAGLPSLDLVSKNKKQKPEQPKLLGNAELYTAQLAQELFTNMTTERQYRYAVAGFVPVLSMQYDSQQQGPLMLLGHQLEQGLLTEVVRRGFIAQEYKATNSIVMSSDSEKVLSRDISQLSPTQTIDYYITGTITEQEGGAMVNARVINVRNKDVIAAATKFFPSELFWQTEKMTLRNGMLYRRSDKMLTPIYSGE